YGHVHRQPLHPFPTRRSSDLTMTKNGEIYTTDNGVTILGKLDQLPTQASQLYGNNLCHLLDDMGKAENFKIDREDDVISRAMVRSEEHTSELQSRENLVCRLL